MTTRGFGATKPVAPNTKPEGHRPAQLPNVYLRCFDYNHDDVQRKRLVKKLMALRQTSASQ
jgi:hypothetical protein